AARLALPPGVVTLSGRLGPTAATVALSSVACPSVMLALVPLNSTALAPVKLVPLIVTLVPTGPLPGVKLVIVGGLITVKLAALLDRKSGVEGLSGALGGAGGTVEVIAVAALPGKVGH